MFWCSKYRNNTYSRLQTGVGIQASGLPSVPLRLLVHFKNADCNRSRLRSATSGAASVVRTRTNLGQRALSVAAPSIWNSLPPSLRLIDSHTVFRRQLKTYLFNQEFDCYDCIL